MRVLTGSCCVLLLIIGQALASEETKANEKGEKRHLLGDLIGSVLGLSSHDVGHAVDHATAHASTPHHVEHHHELPPPIKEPVTCDRHGRRHNNVDSGSYSYTNGMHPSSMSHSDSYTDGSNSQSGSYTDGSNSHSDSYTDGSNSFSHSDTSVPHINIHRHDHSLDHGHDDDHYHDDDYDHRFYHLHRHHYPDREFYAELAQPLLSDNLPPCAVIGGAIAHNYSGIYMQLFYNKMNTSLGFWDEDGMLSWNTPESVREANGWMYNMEEINMGKFYPDIYTDNMDENLYADAYWRYWNTTVFIKGDMVHVYNYTRYQFYYEHWADFGGGDLLDGYPRSLAEELNQDVEENVPLLVTAALYVAPMLYLFQGDLVFSYQVGGIFPNVEFRFTGSFDIVENSPSNPFAPHSTTTGLQHAPGRITAAVADPESEYFVVFSGRTMYRFTFASQQWDDLGIVYTPCNPASSRYNAKTDCDDADNYVVYYEFQRKQKMTPNDEGCMMAAGLEYNIEWLQYDPILNGVDSWFEVFLFQNWFPYNKIDRPIKFELDLEEFNYTLSADTIRGLLSNGDCTTGGTVMIWIENNFVCGHLETVDEEGNHYSASWLWNDMDAWQREVIDDELDVGLYWDPAIEQAILEIDFKGDHVAIKDEVEFHRHLKGDYIAETGLSMKIGKICFDCVEYFYIGEIDEFFVDREETD